MPAFHNIPGADLLVLTTRMYTGVRDNAEIAAALKDYGYGKTAGDDGLALVAALRDAMRIQSTENDEKLTAGKASTIATAAVRTPLVRHRRLARRAHPRGSAGHAALALGGPLPTYETDVFVAARRFYEAVRDTPALATIRSLSPEAITASLARLDVAESAEDDQIREAGESQRATALRQTAEAALRAEAAELAEAATDALLDKPQLREVLGLMERGS
ncbi:MAG TPA: hypothetical protein VGB53_01695 [Rubricoccaceae bacterium]